MSKNLVNYLILGQFLTYLQNCCLLSECLHTQIINKKIVIKFLLLDKKWQGLQYHNFHQYQHIFAVVGWNHPYTYIWCLTKTPFSKMPSPLPGPPTPHINLTPSGAALSNLYIERYILKPTTQIDSVLLKLQLTTWNFW